MMFVLRNGEVKYPQFYVNGRACFSDSGKEELLKKYPNAEVTEVVADESVLEKVKGKTFNSYDAAKAFIEGTSVEILKEELTSTDYRIIKCYEYSLVGKEPPYDVQALHKERQAIRNRINELEEAET